MNVIITKMFVNENEYTLTDAENYAKENGLVLTDVRRVGIITKLMNGYKVLDPIYCLIFQTPVEINIFGKKIETVW